MTPQLPTRESKNTINRRKFINTTATTAAAFSIVPRHVLGGPAYVPPSDKITVANIGCGTQGLREMPGLLENPDIQVVAVCDPNKLTTNYLDWSPDGIRNRIRSTLEDPEWGAQYQGIPGGRDIARNLSKNITEKTNHPVNTKDAAPTKIIVNCSQKKKMSTP